MKIATVQMKMKWRSEENLETMLTTNAYAASKNANVVIYPELALTGYHREIMREISAVLNTPSFVTRLKASAKNHQLFVWVGLPIQKDDALLNAYQCYGPEGETVAEICKIGLTEGEKIIFTAGTTRPVIDQLNLRTSVFLCRESADLDDLKAELGPHPPDLLFWPGYIGNLSANPEGLQGQAYAISEAMSVNIVQSNWSNSLNVPEQDDLGGSIVLGRNGKLIGRCPNAQAGLGFIDMKTEQFRWDPTSF